MRLRDGSCDPFCLSMSSRPAGAAQMHACGLRWSYIWIVESTAAISVFVCAGVVCSTIGGAGSDFCHVCLLRQSDMVLLCAGIKKNSITMFSAHQMGTARMGTDPKKSCVNPQGECWEVSTSSCPLSPHRTPGWHALRSRLIVLCVRGSITMQFWACSHLLVL